MKINKKSIEKQLGYEINDFKIEPVCVSGKTIGLNIKVSPKKPIEFIDLEITINK